MPELPEVETVARGLRPHLEGAQLSRVIIRRPDLRRPFPPGFVESLEGRLVSQVGRRAKYLVAECDDGTALLMHLGMSGRFTVHEKGNAAMPGVFFHGPNGRGQAEDADLATENGHQGEPVAFSGAGPHDHVIFETGRGTRIVYTDHRRFGLMDLGRMAALQEHPLLAGLGIEPLGPDLTPGFLERALGGKRAPLKAALLDQRIIAGLGNIYVCEALYRARLSPTREAGTLSRADSKRLVTAVRTVLKEAIAAGGSSLRDYAQADGAMGYFQHRFQVYGREGDLCPKRRCGPVERIVQSNRSTFFCPVCQK